MKRSQDSVNSITYFFCRVFLPKLCPPLFFSDFCGMKTTLLETNSSPLKIGLPNRKVVFQPSIFRGKLLVSGMVQFGNVFTLPRMNELEEFLEVARLALKEGLRPTGWVKTPNGNHPPLFCFFNLRFVETMPPEI